MPARLLDRLENFFDKFIRHIFVKEIAHAVDEDELRFLPFQRLAHPFWPQGEIEAHLIWMPLTPRKRSAKVFA